MTSTGTASLGTLVVYLTGNASQYERMLKSVEASTGATMEAVLRTTKYATAAVVTSLALIGGASVREYGKFDEAMTNSLAIMENVSAGMRKEMEGVARQLSLSTTTSAVEAAKAYRYLASAGLSAQQSMAALPSVVKFASASTIDAATATGLLTRSVAGLGLASKDAAEYQKNMNRVMDVLTQAANTADGDATDYAVALRTKVSSALRMVNKDLEEGVAVLMAYGKQGILAENAGEQLNQVLRDLQRSSQEMPEIWKKFGLAVYDAQGKMLPIVNIIEQMERVLGPMNDEQKRATLTLLGFQDRSVSAMTSLLGMSGSIKEYEAILRKAGGATDEVANKQLTSFNAQLTMLWHHIQDIEITIGEKLLPVLLVLNEYFKEFTKTTNNAESGVDSLATTIKNVLIGAIGGAADVIYGWRLILTGVEMAFTTLGGVVAWFSKSVEVGIFAASTVIEKSLMGWKGIIDITIYGLKLGLNKFLLWVRETQIAAAEGLNKVLPDAHKYKESWFAPLREEVAKLKADIDGVKPPSLNMDTINGAALEKATAEWKQFWNEQDVFSQRNIELKNRLWDLANQGAPSEKFKTAIKNAETVVQQALDDFQLKNIDKPYESVVAGVNKIGAAIKTITPEFVEFQTMTQDPLAGAYESVKKFDKVLQQNQITLDQYKTAVRDVVSSNNQFISPVAGMHNPNTGIDQMDSMVSMDNENKLMEDQYKRKMEIMKAYYDEKKNVDAQAAQVTLDLMKEMEQRWLENSAVYQQKRTQLILNTSSNMFSDLAQISKTAFGEQTAAYKAMFVVSKAFAIAESMVAISTGIAKAASEKWPLNLAAMASVVAATANIVSNIQAVSLSFEGGGDTPDGPRVGGIDGKGGFLAVMHPNETVIDNTIPNSDTNQRSGGTVIQITQTFTGGVTERDLMLSAAKTKQDTIEAVVEGISRGGQFRQAMHT